MSSVWELKDRIREVEGRLDRVTRDMDAEMRRIQDEMSARIRHQEAEMRSDAKARDKAVREEYEKLLREYQSSIDRENADKFLEMDKSFRRLWDDQRTLKAKMSDLMGRLQDRLEELERGEAEKSARESREADEQMREALKACDEAVRTPFEKFNPSRMKSLKDQLDAAMNYRDIGMNEAATAIFVSVSVGFRQLVNDVNEETRNWEGQFELFRGQANLTGMRLEQMLRDCCSLIGGGVQSAPMASEVVSGSQASLEDEAALDFWTRGLYENARERVGDFVSQIHDVERNGISAYLKKPDGMSAEGMKDSVVVMRGLDEKLKTDAFRGRYVASCERLEMAEKIAEYFQDELDFLWIEEESRYRPVQDSEKDMPDFVNYMKLVDGAYEAGQEAQDMREWFEMVLENSAGVRLFIYIVPHEFENGVTNRIELHVDSQGIVSEEYASSMREYVMDAIGKGHEGIELELISDARNLGAEPDRSKRAIGESLKEKMRKMRSEE